MTRYHNSSHPVLRLAGNREPTRKRDSPPTRSPKTDTQGISLRGRTALPLDSGRLSPIEWRPQALFDPLSGRRLPVCKMDPISQAMRECNGKETAQNAASGKKIQARSRKVPPVVNPHTVM